ncbi:RNA-directed DNA polymerase (Reverse transcriptase), Ribonuclease H-like protein [Gossypium australe]|uniref:RNA-directed DNA polymerase (Reverse transcriptase), Ribonuclease H-like protein n=1 Tax=Gossypium australe TaxID=47621 RepID=A0A5B6WTM7_9ROSI|nr:RNA-directed DNA polymerase (Reverse transcriptase), Ribonuclease H-like protein [Gossypium australe]
MCIDYRDLNKASSKENFPLPHINTLVDNMVGYSQFSFMNDFSGYNQIKMHPEYMEKTTFMTMWGTFCYKVMPFGLKNVGATYQRAMVTLFHDLMHKEIKVYVNDMIAKSRTEKEHVQVLRKLYLRLRKFQLKLNLAKSTFGARSGKLLGFVVSKKGIEIDPDKVKAIQELPPSRRLNYIARFISQLTEKCDLIFRLLKKHNLGVWDEVYQKTFDKVKHYLSNAPMLMPRSPNKSLILYLAVFENSMGFVLGQHDESGRKERAIYYLNKKFTKCGTRYSPIEKLCCALIWTTRRLRQYILYHTTWLILKLDLLKYMMEEWPSGKFCFPIYVNQKAIKGSAIADFLASRALEDYEPLNFDFPNEDLIRLSIRSSLETKLRRTLKRCGKLDFDCTNNVAEYEAFIMGICAAIERKIKVLEVYGDSTLVIYQVKGEWETRDPKLINYQRLVLELIEEFDNITFYYLLRNENQMADNLATLTSMIKVNKQEDVKPIQMSIYEAPTHCYNVEEEEKDDHP